jgi:multisubunit Na+/H+ antiporter MnhE subunit
MGKYLKGKMTISQAFFGSAFSAIVITILENYIHYDNRYIAGIVAGLITFIGFMLGMFIFRNVD